MYLQSVFLIAEFRISFKMWDGILDAAGRKIIFYSTI